ncbi:MAG: DNA-deoxyinosine glycosylase [Comamonadaceae bacterium]|nr:DNA-deoxyinosine glycosylase [Comamonadaceae bacterium]
MAAARVWAVLNLLAQAIQSSARLQGLPPQIASHTRMLVLGSFPGVTSLARQQYYAHPHNAFWKILQAVWPSSPYSEIADSYQNRIDWMLDKGLGLWDVYASCQRVGSLDSAIEQPQRNDLAQLIGRTPGLQLIAHNGGESFKHARYTRTLGLPVYRLPSTSPANASWTFERKLAAWREVVALAGLL